MWQSHGRCGAGERGTRSVVRRADSVQARANLYVLLTGTRDCENSKSHGRQPPLAV